jgi:spore coat polysaccharide biosynthesis protein SpsF (cytidylyltransferase family)
MRTVAIIQARMGSTRLPGKTLRPLAGRPMLWHIVQRARKASGVDEVAVATSSEPTDEPIRCLCAEQDIPVISGSEEDVLDRFYKAAVYFKADPVIRITADCPFVDPVIIGRLIDLYKSVSYDHVGVAAGAGASLLGTGRFPDGLDAECVRLAALKRAWTEATDAAAREHVTFYIWRNPALFRCGVLTSETDLGHLRLTVDQEADYQLACAIYDALYSDNPGFALPDILQFLSAHPAAAETNRGLIATESYRQLLDPWVRAGTLSRADSTAVSTPAHPTANAKSAR